MSKMTKLRLKGVVQCSFARSEATNMRLYRQTGHFPGELERGEAYLFVAKGQNQVLFLFADVQVDFDGVSRQVIDSRKLRLAKGTWSPYMLQNYANSVGLELVGIKRFEQILAYQAKMKRGAWCTTTLKLQRNAPSTTGGVRSPSTTSGGSG